MNEKELIDKSLLLINKLDKIMYASNERIADVKQFILDGRTDCENLLYKLLHHWDSDDLVIAKQWLEDLNKTKSSYKKQDWVVLEKSYNESSNCNDFIVALEITKALEIENAGCFIEISTTVSNVVQCRAVTFAPNVKLVEYFDPKTTKTKIRLEAM